MKIFITTLTLAALIATSAMAKNIKPTDEDAVRCGSTTLKDPDANVRADFQRNCASYNRPATEPGRRFEYE
jgi:hypothetical protein